MPRGQKSKARSREKHRQTKTESQELEGTQTYQFLWGPKAYAETNQVKVMEFLANINETGSSIYPFNYEEALREEDRPRSEGAAQRSTTCKTKRRSKTKSSLPTC